MHIYICIIYICICVYVHTLCVNNFLHRRRLFLITVNYNGHNKAQEELLKYSLYSSIIGVIFPFTMKC